MGQNNPPLSDELDAIKLELSIKVVTSETTSIGVILGATKAGLATASRVKKQQQGKRRVRNKSDVTIT